MVLAVVLIVPVLDLILAQFLHMAGDKEAMLVVVAVMELVVADPARATYSVGAIRLVKVYIQEALI